jgi:hypothetical protein
MRRVLLAALAAPLWLAAAPVPEPVPPSGDSPRIRVEPQGFDFGRALPRRTLRKQFVLRNAGERDLVLQRPTTSCACTAAIVGETTLKPGRSTTLNVELYTRARAGLIEQRVLVPSNDPVTPLLELRVRATVEAPARK